MDLEIHGDTTEALDQHIRDRFTAALDQHEAHVQHVTVRLSDANGPKGGVDQVCKVRVKLNLGEDLHIAETNQDMYASISLAADRVKQAAGRMLHRKTEHREGKVARR